MNEMTPTWKEENLLKSLEKMTDRRRIAFLLSCLKRIPIQRIFEKSDILLFSDTLNTIELCLQEKANKHDLDKYIEFINPRCAELHNDAVGKPVLSSLQHVVNARSLSADAIYSVSEIAYSYYAHLTCPLSMTYTLETIRKAVNWANQGRIQKEDELEWQAKEAEKFLSADPYAYQDCADITPLRKTN